MDHPVVIQYRLQLEPSLWITNWLSKRTDVLVQNAESRQSVEALSFTTPLDLSLVFLFLCSTWVVFVHIFRGADVVIEIEFTTQRNMRGYLFLHILFLNLSQTYAFREEKEKIFYPQILCK